MISIHSDGFPWQRSVLLLMISASVSCVNSNRNVELPAVGSSQQNAQQVLQYWTPERMRNAAYIDGPADLSPLEPPLGGDRKGYLKMTSPYVENLEANVTGVLFYRNERMNVDTHCSASVLKSRTQSLIITAAHCTVFPNPDGELFSRHMLFVPAYDGSPNRDLHDAAPYGRWPISRAYVSENVAHNPLLIIGSQYDLSIASVFPGADGRRLEEVVGGALQPVVTDSEDFSEALTVGYPSAQYGGQSQYYCKSALVNIPYPVGAPGNDAPGSLGASNCGVTGGHSGGPVIVGQGVVGVVHGGDHTRLRPSTYPAQAAAAEADFPLP
jgi:hypothetical protein